MSQMNQVLIINQTAMKTGHSIMLSSDRSIKRSALMANIRGKRIKVFMGGSYQLWTWITIEDWINLPDREVELGCHRVSGPGQHTIASHHPQVILFLKTFVAKCERRDRWISIAKAAHPFAGKAL